MPQNQSLQAYKTRDTQKYDWDDPIIEDLEGWDHSLREVHEALLANEGRMAQTASQLKVKLSLLGRVIQAVPALHEIVLLHREMLIDEAENTVRKAVISGDGLLAMAVLRSAGKHRGWGEKDNLVQADNKILIEYVNDWRGGGSADVDPDDTGVIDVEVVNEEKSSKASSEATEATEAAEAPVLAATPVEKLIQAENSE